MGIRTFNKDDWFNGGVRIFKWVDLINGSNLIYGNWFNNRSSVIQEADWRSQTTPKRDSTYIATVYIICVHKKTWCTQCIYTTVYITLTPARPPLDTHGCPLTTLVKDKLFTGHLLESARDFIQDSGKCGKKLTSTPSITKTEWRVTALGQVRMQMQLTKRNSDSFKGGGFLAGTGLSRPRMRPGGEEVPGNQAWVCSVSPNTQCPCGGTPQVEVEVKKQFQFSSVQSFSHVPLFETPRTAARQASLSITNSRSLPKLMCIKLVMPSSHLILGRPLLLLPPNPPSIRVFSNESTQSIGVSALTSVLPMTT